MGLFNRSKQPASAPSHEQIDLANPVDWDAAKRAADAVNKGDLDAAQRIVDATDHPRHTAFAAFRFIDGED